MLKNVEDASSLNEKRKGAQEESIPRDESTVVRIEENDTKKTESTIRKVHFAENNACSAQDSLSLKNGTSCKPTLSSILKPNRVDLPESTEQSKSKKTVLQLPEVQIPSRLNADQNPDTMPTRQRRSRAKDLVEATTPTQTNHNRTRRSRKSIENVTTSISTELPNNSNVNAENTVILNKASNVVGKAKCRSSAKPRSKGKGKSLVDDGGEISTDLVVTADEVEANDDSLNETNTVKCARCSAEMATNKWPFHNLSLHNNMGWLESSPALDLENDQKLLVRILTGAHKKKKGALTCEQCNTVKRSVVGFISHMQFCGKSIMERSALLVTCPICMRTMMPSSLEVHHRVHRQSTDSPGVLESKSQDTLIVATGSKRKAAERAISKISEFTALVRENDEPAAKKIRSTSPTIKQMIKRPQLRKTIPGVLKALWNNEITTNGTAYCRQPGCTAKFEILDEIYKHYSTCNFTPRKTFSCKICKFDAEKEVDIVTHVAETHVSDQSYKEESESDESSDDECENEALTKKNDCTNRTTSHLWKTRHKTWHKIDFLAREDNPIRYKAYGPTVQWTMDFELENYQLDLFPNLIPNTFELLIDKEAETYLPELEVSIATQKMHMKHRNENIECASIEWKRWKKFEGAVNEGMPTFFVGGPVWAMSWLPIPAPLYSKNVDQYLAVSTHPTMESEYSLGRSYTGKNVIQMWNVGKLNNKGGSVEGVPTLAYAIAHTSGTVWCMEWCPSGCYQDNVLSNYHSTNGEQIKLKRIGLLAAACSDGCVQIFSMPFPEELESLKLIENKWRIFKTEPVATLVVNAIMYNNGKQNWQCTKLNWTKEHGHDTIVAGFSNGYVALWNLATESPLLSKKRGNTKFVNAYQHFFAHGHAVSVAVIIPYGGKRFIATAGLDRCYKFWDLENVGGPQGLLKRGVVVDGAWLTHWPTAVNSFDDVLGLNHTCTNLVALREYGYKICLTLATNSPVYAVSVSDYANAIAHGSLAGEVQINFSHQLLVGIDVDRALAKKRRLNSIVKVVDLCEAKSSPNKISPNTTIEESKKDSEDYKYVPDTYEGCKDRFGIIFYDVPSEMKENYPVMVGRKTLQTEDLAMVPLEAYPLASVNRVSWNPNAWSYLWLASGYQCGLIRISCFKTMYMPATMNQMLPKHVNQLFAKVKKNCS